MSIELNFLALQEQVFDFTIYVRAYSGNEKSNFYIASLSVNNKESTLIGEHRERFEVSLSSIEGFFERLVNCTENHCLTIWYISPRIYQGKEFLSNHYRRDSFNKNNPVSYIRAEDVQGGYRELSVRPFYYKKVKLFGFIYGFHYKKENIDEKLNTLDLINSFSLDKGGKSNKNKNYDVRKYLFI